VRGYHDAVQAAIVHSLALLVEDVQLDLVQVRLLAAGILQALQLSPAKVRNLQNKCKLIK
jgi:hypothetical protein